ncbi:MAG: site-specific integrase [Ignavibacteria bacterium]|nr:site-specific integrase [Ignavibacteria bacterium]
MAAYPRMVKVGLRYYYKFQYNNITYKSKAIYLSKNDAKKAEAEKYTEVTTTTSNPSLKPTPALSDIMTDRLTDLKAKKGEKYYKQNKEYFKKLLQHTKNIPVNTVKRSMIEEFLTKQANLHKKKKQDNYAVNAMLRSFKALFYYAIDVKEIEMTNPCKKIGEYSIKKKIKYIPPEKDIEAIRAICTPEQLYLLDFVDETAARINEPLNMYGKDIFSDKIILHTRKSKNSNVVPRKLPRPACMEGKTYKYSERVFPWWTKEPKFLMKKIKKLGQRPWGFHSLRHRRASLWNKEKKTEFEIMTLLGHSDLKTTQIYLQMLP